MEWRENIPGTSRQEVWGDFEHGWTASVPETSGGFRIVQLGLPPKTQGAVILTRTEILGRAGGGGGHWVDGSRAMWARRTLPAVHPPASWAQALKQEAAAEASLPWGSSLHWLEETADPGEVLNRVFLWEPS